MNNLAWPRIVLPSRPDGCMNRGGFLYFPLAVYLRYQLPPAIVILGPLRPLPVANLHKHVCLALSISYVLE